MKKHFLSCLLMGALLASSCSDTDEAVLDSEIGNHAGNSTVPVTVPKVFQARFAEQVNGGTGTQKTYFDGASATPFLYNFASTDRVQFLSSSSDKSVIFTNKNASGSEASFSTDEEVPDGFADGEAFVAVMPPQANALCDYHNEENIIIYDVEIPSVQTAVKDSYDPNAHVFVSMSLGMPTEFSFYTLNSFLLIANESDIEFEKIVCVSNDKSNLAGKISFDQNWQYWDFWDWSNSITLNGPILPKSNYFITLVPGTLYGGYKLLGYCADGSVYEYKVVKRVEFVRNHIRGVKPKWEKYVPVLDESLMRSAIPSDKATSITFGKKSEYSDVSFTGDYVGGKFVGVYISNSDPSVFYVLSEDDGEIIAPEDCSDLFAYYKVLKTLSLNNFNTANVFNMYKMFNGCSGLTNLTFGDNFNTANVTDMYEMFSGCSGLTNLTLGDNFNTANVNDMYGMFSGCSGLTSLTFDDNFNTANVTDMSSMFNGCSGLTNLTLGDNFNTANVTDMSEMFSGCSGLTNLTLGDKFNTANVTDMFEMFYGCSGLTNLILGDKFNTANVTNMDRMFYGCSALTNLTFGDYFNTSKVTDMYGMFRGCNGLTSLDLGDNFNTSSVENMSLMFYSCLNLKTIYITDKFSTGKVTSSNGMFDGCTSLVGGMGTKYNSSNTDATYAKFDGGASAPGYFTLKTNLSIEKENDKDVDGWD